MNARWYLAQLLFAQATENVEAAVLCESSYVLFEAASAREAYDKAVDWGHKHEQDSTFSLLGVRHLNSLDEPPADGVEVGGGFFEETAAWMRINELIPARDEIPIIVFEQNPDTPIGELIDDDTDAKLRRLFPTNPGSDEPPN
jgi:Domain of unknown function (DUF4288)